MKIFKYQITFKTLRGFNSIETFNNSKIIDIQISVKDAETFDVWVEVDTREPHTTKKIACVGTGHEMSENLGSHIKTIQMPNGLVWHFYNVVQ